MAFFRLVTSTIRSNCSVYLFYTLLFMCGYTLYVNHYNNTDQVNLHLNQRQEADEAFEAKRACSSGYISQEYLNTYTDSFQQVGDSDTYVYSAYFDARPTTDRLVRVLGLTDPEPKQKYCLLWYPDGTRISVPAQSVDLLQRFCWIMSAYKHFAYFFHCPIDTEMVPHFVSLTDKPCGETTNRVIVNKIAAKPTGKAGLKMGVCHKTLHHITSSHAVVEWLEMQKLLGASHVTFYGAYNCTQDVMQVLEYYEKQHFVSIQPWPLPWPSTRYWTQGSVELYEFAQQLMVNDCLYRYMDRFRWMAFLDMDEYFIPRDPGMRTYQQMLLHLEKENADSQKIVSFKLYNSHFCLSKSHVFQGMSNFITMETLKRNQVILGLGKSIIIPRRVVIMDVHYVLEAIKNTRGNVTVSIKYGLMQHYRKLNYSPIEKVPFRPCYIVDDVTLKYAKDLIKNANTVLRVLHLNYTKAEVHLKRFQQARLKAGIKPVPLLPASVKKSLTIGKKSRSLATKN